MNQKQTDITTGKQIRHLRTQSGMTQEELAGKLNVTRQALSNWERDVNEPDLLLPQFNTCSSSGVFDRLLMKKSFDLLRLFLNASHMGFGMFFKLPIPFCRRSFGKGRFQIPVQ